MVGITLIGLLFWAVLISSVALVAMKVFPAVTEYRTILSMVNKIADSGGSTVPLCSIDRSCRLPMLTRSQDLSRNCCVCPSSSVPSYKTRFSALVTRTQQRPLEVIFKEMPIGYKLVFNLAVFEEKKHQEIAEILNISEGTSKSQLSKAKKWLQDYFNQHQNTKQNAESEI